LSNVNYLLLALPLWILPYENISLASIFI